MSLLRQRYQRISWLLPDLLTLARLPIGLALFALGIIKGPSAIDTAFWLLLFGWTTDVLDGKIARTVKKEPSWIGRQDIYFDAFMLLGLIFYLGLSGFVPFALCLGYAFLMAYVFRPKMPHKARLIVESPLAIISFPLTIYFAQSGIVTAVAASWCVLSLVYDIDRARALAKTWQGIFLDFYQAFRAQAFRTHLAWISFFGSIALIVFNGIILVHLLPKTLYYTIYAPPAIAVLRAIYILWIERGKKVLD